MLVLGWFVVTSTHGVCVWKWMRCVTSDAALQPFMEPSNQMYVETLCFRTTGWAETTVFHDCGPRAHPVFDWRGYFRISVKSELELAALAHATNQRTSPLQSLHCAGRPGHARRHQEDGRRGRASQPGRPVHRRTRLFGARRSVGCAPAALAPWRAPSAPRSRRTGASDPRARAATPGLPQQLIPRAAAGTAAGDAARRTDARHATASDDPVGRQSAARMSPATVATAAVRPAPPMRHARGAAALRAACREVAPAT